MIRRTAARLAWLPLVSCAAQPIRVEVNRESKHNDPAAEVRAPVQSSEVKRWHDLRALIDQRLLRPIGRYAPSSSGAIRMAWSGTGMTLRFNGTAVGLTHRGPRVRYAAFLDGEKQEDFFFQQGEQHLALFQGLSQGEHTLQIARQGEALFGLSEFVQVEITDGALLPIEGLPPRRLEIYGDSITCGYGNEGKNVECGFSAETENHYLSYGQILARNLKAELTTIAWSGKGVASNYAGEPTPTLVQIAELTAPPEEGSWSYPIENAPQGVIINLGTNDYSTDHDPSVENFVGEYRKLLSGIRSHYPDAFILATVGPLLSGDDLLIARRNIKSVVDSLNKSGDQRISSYELKATNDDPGCDYHPGLATHRRMADELEAELRRHLNW